MSCIEPQIINEQVNNHRILNVKIGIYAKIIVLVTSDQFSALRNILTKSVRNVAQQTNLKNEITTNYKEK